MTNQKRDFKRSAKHRRSTADASPRSIGDGSAMDHQTIGDITTSNLHRRCSQEHRRCVADVSLMCRRCVWYIFNLGVHRRMFADCSAIYRRWYLASKQWEKISMHALKLSPIIRGTTGAWWRCPGNAQI